MVSKAHPPFSARTATTWELFAPCWYVLWYRQSHSSKARRVLLRFKLLTYFVRIHTCCSVSQAATTLNCSRKPQARKQKEVTLKKCQRSEVRSITSRAHLHEKHARTQTRTQDTDTQTHTHTHPPTPRARTPARPPAHTHTHTHLHTHTHTHTHRQTDRQTDRQTHTHTTYCLCLGVPLCFLKQLLRAYGHTTHTHTHTHAHTHTHTHARTHTHTSLSLTSLSLTAASTHLLACL